MQLPDPGKLPQALPLRALHLPPAPGWWPPAPGWWAIAGLLLILAILLLLFWQRIRRLRYRRQALRRLAVLESAEALTASELLAELSMLLRRAALCAFPEESCAALTGEDWLCFLDRPLKERPFSAGIGRCLAAGPYQPQVEIDRGSLLNLCRHWLRRLPPTPRRRRKQ